MSDLKQLFQSARAEAILKQLGHPEKKLFESGPEVRMRFEPTPEQAASLSVGIKRLRQARDGSAYRGHVVETAREVIAVLNADGLFPMDAAEFSATVPGIARKVRLVSDSIRLAGAPVVVILVRESEGSASPDA